jgi:hypothetical protein
MCFTQVPVMVGRQYTDAQTRRQTGAAAVPTDAVSGWFSYLRFGDLVCYAFSLDTS